MKYLKVIAMFIIMASGVYAQVDTLWTKTYGAYGGSVSDVGYSVQQTTDGGFIIAGCTGSYDLGYDVYLIRTDANGNTLWSKTYGVGSDDWGYSVQQTTDGGFIVAGYTYPYGAGNRDVYLIRTDANGDTLWTKTYGGSNGDGGYSVQQTQDGGFIIAGETNSYGAGGPDVYLIRTDANGDTLWTRTYGGSGYDYGQSVQQITDGGFIIAGYTHSYGAGGYDVYLIRTDANGNTLWTKTYGGSDYDYGYSVQETQDGGFIIAGTKLIRTDENGDTLWTKPYWGHSVQQTTDGGFIIAGETYSYATGSEDVYLIRITPIELISPNGGEHLIGNSIYNIVWQSDNASFVNYFRLLLSTDGGATYPDIIATNIPNTDTSYTWTVPDTINSTSCRVKVEALDSSNNVLYYDLSDRVLSIQIIHLLSPNGGESLIGNSTYNIVWQCNDTSLVNYFRLLLSTDSGITYPDTIATNIQSDDTSYTWTVSDTISSSCKVKVEALDSSNNVLAYDESDSVFSISQNIIHLLSPNGGESLIGNSTYNIAWQCDDTSLVNYFRLLLSTDSGMTYPDTIATNIPNSYIFFYAWRVPNTISSSCKVKVEALDSSNNVLTYDESDSVFSIISTSVEEKPRIPRSFAIREASNPITGYTIIYYQLPHKSRVSLKIYNVAGRLVKDLVEGEKEAGYYSIKWDVRGIKSGIYFIEFRADNYKYTRKIVVR